MKILAIRGKNLASLAGEFSIDFCEQPLASAGLFAICGPTGAGKSTLLDALCLALYDKTPRLQQAVGKGVQLRDVGDETLPPHDARTLLRRGCADGYAEVEFIGNDRRHYRSRWSVRRAHGRADRKLQATEMQLLRLPEQQAIGGKKSEVQEAIIEKLGLNFEQFTRAVLLAQNEFSVFLKAPDDERASLLETLTGTDEYSRLSIRAFERAKREQAKLDELTNLLALQQPLEPEQRQEREAQKQALAQNLAEANRQKAAIDSHLQWHHRFQALQTAENEAQQALQQAQIGHQQAQSRRDYLTRVEALQDARPLLTEYDRLTEEHQQQQLQLDTARSALAAAVSRQKSMQDGQLAAKQRLATTEQDRLRILADITQARALDAEIGSLTPRHNQHQQALAQARQTLQKLDAELSQTQQSRDETDRRLTECAAWLESHAMQANLSREWPRWDILFKQAKAGSSQLQAADFDRAHAENALRQAQTDVMTAQTQVADIQTGLSIAEQNHQTAQAAATRFDAEALTTSHDRHRLRLEQLRQAESIWQTLTQLNAAYDSHHEKLRQSAGQRQRNTEQLQTLREQLPALIAAHEQTVKMLDLAKLACSEHVETLRARLREDCECPVCGSRQHPFADGAHPFRDELGPLEQELKACQALRHQAEQQESRLRLELEQLDKQCREWQASVATLQTQIATRQTLWAAHALTGELAQRDGAQITAWLSEQIQATETAQQVVSQSMKAMSAALTQRDQARQALDDIVHRQRAAQTRLDQTASAVREAEIGVKNVQEKQQGLQIQLQQQLDELDAAFDSTAWRQEWLADHAVFYKHSQQQAQAWQAQQTAQQQLTNESTILRTTLTGLQAHRRQAQARVEEASQDFTAIDAELSGKQNQRQALLDGRPVVDVEAALEKSLAVAKAGLQTADEAVQQAATQAATAQEKQSQWQTSLTATQIRHDAAEQALGAWLDAFAQTRPLPEPLAMPQLRRHLQHDSHWLNQERQALQQLDQALSQARTILNERRLQCEQYLNARASLESLENLQAQGDGLTATLNDLTQQQTELALQLRLDDERLQASADLRVNIAAQTAINETWSKLNSVIGSASGKTFRNIAQRLTLDILLGYANRHLKDLNRRYRLERVGDTLALQVVDQDMGDEIRSVHSLSGGESFLLSLALALGLASLSSNRVRVESLFIDEGFGGLDTETLRVAMDALDSLQALGRKVGVISHVQEMTERIGTRIEVRRIGSGLSQVVIA